MNTLLLGFCLVIAPAQAAVPGDERDRGIFMRESDTFKQQLREKAGRGGMSEPPPKVLKMNLRGVDVPTSPDEFQQAWHRKPVCQGLTGDCWSYSATSFMESEVHRLTGKDLRLSESWTVYWEFVEKARHFVRQRGRALFPRGSEPDALLAIWKQHGTVPAESYRGRLATMDYHDDEQLFREMSQYLGTVKQRGEWDEEAVVSRIRSMLDKVMGAPPEKLNIDGASVTPGEYLRNVVGIDADQYVSVISLMERPYHQWCDYPVDDNWRNARTFYNVPVDDFISIVRRAARSGYSVCLGGDISEPGYCFEQNVALIPSFDIPTSYIDDAARQSRFSNGMTSDDHAIHLVGWTERKGRDWYLIKDSGTKARNGRFPGYNFFREDYVRLKMLMLLVPRDIVERTLGKPLPAPSTGPS